MALASMMEERDMTEVRLEMVAGGRRGGDGPCEEGEKEAWWKKRERENEGRDELAQFSSTSTSHFLLPSAPRERKRYQEAHLSMRTRLAPISDYRSSSSILHSRLRTRYRRPQLPLAVQLHLDLLLRRRRSSDSFSLQDSFPSSLPDRLPVLLLAIHSMLEARLHVLENLLFPRSELVRSISKPARSTKVPKLVALQFREARKRVSELENEILKSEGKISK